VGRPVTPTNEYTEKFGTVALSSHSPALAVMGEGWYHAEALQVEGPLLRVWVGCKRRRETCCVRLAQSDGFD